MSNMNPPPDGPGVKTVPSQQSRVQMEEAPLTLEPHVTAWVGWVAFAALMMMIVGVLHAIEGIVALFKDSYYVVSKSGLVLTMDYTTWGWVHLTAGVIVAAAGVGLLSGRMWARVIAVIVTMLSIIANFLFIAAYPIWSTMLITGGVLVLYALTAHGGEMKDVSDRT